MTTLAAASSSRQATTRRSDRDEPPRAERSPGTQLPAADAPLDQLRTDPSFEPATDRAMIAGLTIVFGLFLAMIAALVLVIWLLVRFSTKTKRKGTTR